MFSVFDGGLYQQLGANSSEDRDSWLQALQLASYDHMRSQLLSLRNRIEACSGHKFDTDIQMLRLQRGIVTGSSRVFKCETDFVVLIDIFKNNIPWSFFTNALISTFCRSCRNSNLRSIFSL